MAVKKELPENLKYTLIALYAQLVIGFIYFLFTYDQIGASIKAQNPALTGENIPSASQSIIMAHCFNTLIYTVIFYLMYLGKSWSRVVYLVLTVAGLPFVIKALPQAMERPTSAVIYFITVGISMGALYILFFTPAKEYFRKPESGDDDDHIKTPDHLLS